MKKILSVLLIPALLVSAVFAGCVSYDEKTATVRVQPSDGEHALIAAYDREGRLDGILIAEDEQTLDVSQFEGDSVSAFFLDGQERPTGEVQQVTERVELPQAEYTEVSSAAEMIAALWQTAVIGQTADSKGSFSWQTGEPVYLRLTKDLTVTMTNNSTAGGSPFSSEDATKRQTVYVAPGSAIDLNGHTLTVNNLRFYYAEGSEVCEDQTAPLFFGGSLRFGMGNNTNTLWAFSAAEEILGGCMTDFFTVSENAFSADYIYLYRAPENVAVHMAHYSGSEIKPYSTGAINKTLYIPAGSTLDGGRDFHTTCPGSQVVLGAASAADLSAERLTAYAWTDKIELTADIDAPGLTVTVPEGAVLDLNGFTLNCAGIVGQTEDSGIARSQRIPVDRETALQALYAVVRAYYNKNPYTQYEGKCMSIETKVTGPHRLQHYASPEYGSVDQALFSQCTDYVVTLYHETFGYEFMNGYKAPGTSRMVHTPEPELAYYRDGITSANVNEAVAELRSLLQPGDIIATAGDTGHVLIWLGDYLGDGVNYVTHCWGAPFDPDTGNDPWEANGSTKIQPENEVVFGPKVGSNPNWNLYEPARNSDFIALIRPFASPDFEWYITPATATRMQYPEMVIDRYTDVTKYNDVLTGQDITVTVKIENRSTEAYVGLEITDALPEGTVLKSGQTAWTVDVPAGQTVTRSYVATVTAARGETVFFPAGSVGNIPTREMSYPVGGAHLTQAQQNALSAAVVGYIPAALKATGMTQLDFANIAYRELLGIELELPGNLNDYLAMRFAETVKLGTTEPMLALRDSVPAQYQALADMEIPTFVGGMYVTTGEGVENRAVEYREEYFRPGDLFITMKKPSTVALRSAADCEVFLYLGAGRVLMPTADGAAVATFASTVARSVVDSFYIALRPTLAFDDLNAARGGAQETEYTSVSSAEQLCAALWSTAEIGGTPDANGDLQWSVGEPVHIRLNANLTYSYKNNIRSSGSPFTSSSGTAKIYVAPGSVIDLNGHTLTITNCRFYYAIGPEETATQTTPLFVNGTIKCRMGNSNGTLWCFSGTEGILGGLCTNYTTVSADSFKNTAQQIYRIPAGVTADLTYTSPYSAVTRPKRLIVSPGAKLIGSSDFHTVNAACRVILEAASAADLAPDHLQYPYLDEIVLLADITAPGFVLPAGVTLSYRGHTLNGVGEETVSYTREQMQEAIVQTALAYYYHDPYVQYESTGSSMLKPFALNSIRAKLFAEDAEEDTFVYTICSDFGWRVYHEATGWSRSETSADFLTEQITSLPADDPLVVYKFRGVDGETSVTKAKEDLRACLQPGDIITYTVTSGAGHMMVYVGDLLGDGKQYLLHSDATGGGSTDFDTGVNPLEPGGSIQLESFDDIVYNPNDRYIFGSSVTVFNVIRPLDVLLAEGYSLTPAAASRLAYPRMELHKTFDRSIFDGVQAGQTLTCTLTVANHSTQDYSGLALTEPVPAGQTFVSADCGGVLSDGSVCWTLDVPAGQTKSVSFTILVSGSLGDTVTFGRGTAADIPTRTASLQICGVPLNGAALTAVQRTADLPSGLTFRDLETVRLAYEKLLGIGLELPSSVSALVNALFTTATPYGTTPVLTPRQTVSAQYEAYRKMLLQKHFYGRYAYDGDDTSNRITEFVEDRYQPGDIFVNVVGSDSAQLKSSSQIVLQIYLGGGRALVCTQSGGVKVQSFESSIGTNLRSDFGFTLRPSLAYADINAK